MNRELRRFMNRVIILIVSAGIITPVAGQAINVTARINTATVADTLGEQHFVQIRGDLNGAAAVLPDGKDVTWEVDSDLILQNV
ncbi:MAG: hypothetical protein JSW54_05215, partial [Fidelibacterota bacterium]